MKQLFRLMVAIFCLVAVVACGDSKKTVTNTVKALISAEKGGTLATEDGSSITIPHGALAEDTEITMTVVTTEEFTEAGDDTNYASKVIIFEPHGLIFLKPVLISSPAEKDFEGLVSAAVFNTEDKTWHYSKDAQAVVLSKDEMGDPIMMTAAGDPIMLNAMGDPIMQGAMGDPIMLGAMGDPIMISSNAMGDPIMGAAMGDPIMMTTGHFSAYSFVITPEQPAETDGDPVKPDEDTVTEPDETPRPDGNTRPDEEIVLDNDVVDEDVIDEDVVFIDEDVVDEDTAPECEEDAKECVENNFRECVEGRWSETTCDFGCDVENPGCFECEEGAAECVGENNFRECVEGRWSEITCDFGCDTENTRCFECEVTEGGNYRCHEDVRQVCVDKYWQDWTDEETGAGCGDAGCNAITNDCNVWEEGGVITFGSYEQDNNLENGAEPIEWMILSLNEQSGAALLLSKYGLDAKPYNASGSLSYDYYSSNGYWKDSTIRSWLNGEFYDHAFTTPAQEAKIASTALARSYDYEQMPRSLGLREVSGLATSDRVQLYTTDMMSGYYQSNSGRLRADSLEEDFRVCKPTSYAVAQGAVVNSDNGAGKWWLLEGNEYVNFFGSAVSSSSTLWTSSEFMIRPLITVRLAASPCAEDENGQHRCNVGTSQVCRDGYWIDEAACQYGCDTTEGATFGTCFDCSEYMDDDGNGGNCWDDMMHYCQDGRWVVETDGACEFGCNAYNSACNECVPGSKKCENSSSMICSYYGYWNTNESCGNMGCNETSKECNCENGTSKCEGGASRTCQDQIWGAATTCEFGCDTADGVCSESYTVGNVISMGTFEQDGNGSNGKEPISWYIIAAEDDGIFLLSVKSLVRMRWDDDSNDWATSEIRAWLNGEFYDGSFSTDEKAMIHETELSDVGTTDRIFLLSSDEYDTLPDSMKSAYLVGDGTVYWWLRTKSDDDSYKVVQINTDGTVYGPYSVSYENDTMRPAMWIDLQ